MPPPIIDIPNNLPHTVDVYKLLSVRDELGGDRKSLSLVLSGLRCFVQSSSYGRNTSQARELVDFQKRGFGIIHNVWFKTVDSAMSEETVLLFSGQTLKVISVATATVNRGPSLSKALCQEWSGDLDPAT